VLEHRDIAADGLDDAPNDGRLPAARSARDADDGGTRHWGGILFGFRLPASGSKFEV